MREGDIFKWRYKDTSGMSAPYHCKSQIAILHDGHLRDTYWTDYKTKFIVDPDKCQLEFIANQDDLEPLSKHNRKYFNTKDIVDISHSNSYSENLYVRKGSKPCKQTIKKHIREEIDQLEIELEHAKGRIRLLTEKFQEIEDSDDLTDIWF